MENILEFAEKLKFQDAVSFEKLMEVKHFSFPYPMKNKFKSYIARF